MTPPPLPFTPVPVPRLERASHEEIIARQHGEPVILTGLLNDCRLLGEFRARPSLDQKLALLQDYLRDVKVDFDVLPPSSGGHFLPSFTQAHESVFDVPFSAFADRIKQAPANGDYVYMRNQVITPESPLREALRLDFLSHAPPEDVRSKIWIGSSGQIFNLHYDDFINFICMFEGTKRVTMFSPELLDAMYHAPFDFMNASAPASLVQLLKADLARFPKFRRALEDARVALLEPGDVLLIPPLWWHHVESYGLNVMVNNWILSIPLRTTVEMWKDLSRAIRLLGRATQAERESAREVFTRAVFAPTAASATPEAIPARLEEQVRRARALVATLPPFWQKRHARAYDEFVFQRNGDPFPSEPGALEAMMARHEKSATFYPSANEVDSMLPPA